MIATVLGSAGVFAAGTAAAAILVVAVESFSGTVHLYPDGFQGTHEEICRHVEHYPPWVLAVVAAACGVTAFAGTWTAGRIGNRGTGLCLGMFLLAAVTLNMSMLSYPV